VEDQHRSKEEERPHEGEKDEETESRGGEGRKVELTPTCLTRAALALSLSSLDGNFGGRILSYGSSTWMDDVEMAVEAYLRGSDRTRSEGEEEEDDEAKVATAEVDCLDILCIPI